MRKTQRAAEYFRTHRLIVGRMSSESGLWFTLSDRKKSRNLQGDLSSLRLPQSVLTAASLRARKIYIARHGEQEDRFQWFREARGRGRYPLAWWEGEENICLLTHPLYEIIR